MKVGDVVWFTMERYLKALDRAAQSPYGKGTVTDEYVIENFVFGQKIKRINRYGGTVHVDLELAGAMSYNINSLTHTSHMDMPDKNLLPEELFHV